MRPHSPFRLAPLAALFVLLAPALPARPPVLGIGSARPARASLALDRLDLLDFVQERASRTAEAARTRQVRPVEPGPITGWWGEPRRGHLHTGTDMNGETGDPVVAAAWGTVTHAGPAPKGYGGYGLMVVIDHGEFQTVYAHLSRVDVAMGQVASAGTLIGAIGTTGFVTGSHLHLEVIVGGQKVDPESVLYVLR